ncbi:MAG TPA: HAD hydrolase family protein [Polyangiaceae bacterium]|nr:HAD hydrolase family protein [Polyangiaceae bacterium]
MTSSRRLLAIDLDGTLLDASGRPHARDVKAVQAALAAGVSVSIVTGRLYSGSRAAAEILGLRGAVGCADGSHVVRASDHTTLLHRGVSGAHAVALRRALANAKAATFVFAKDAIGHDAAGTPYVGYMQTWSTDVRIAEDVFEHDLWAADEGVTAVVALGPREPLEEAVRQLQRDAPDAVFVALFPLRRGPHGGTWAVMVRAGAVTKGTAVRWIAEREGVSLADTVCVGDWINDIPMFEVAGRSFAMGQAPDEVKSTATDVLTETAESGGGVASAIERAFGIRSI